MLSFSIGRRDVLVRCAKILGKHSQFKPEQTLLLLGLLVRDRPCIEQVPGMLPFLRLVPQRLRYKP
jgi:hypothetical protein